MQTTRLELPVRGMSCASCVARIEKALAAVPGVQEAQVSLGAERATLTVDPRQVEVPVLADAAMATSSVSVVSNSLRLRRFRPPRAARTLAAGLLLLLGVIAGIVPAAHAQTRVSVAGGAYVNVGPQALRAMLARKDFVFVNVHVPYEGEIAQTDANIPYDQIDRRLGELPAERTARIVLYCRSGRMSATAAETLVRLGYTDVWNLEGGFTAWQQAGFPMRRP